MNIDVFTIVFNIERTMGEDIFRAAMEGIYPIANTITIVEGATRAKNHYFDGNAQFFTQDGKSTDRTLDILYSLHDPDKKTTVYHSQGWWDGKTQMVNKAIENVSGDYLFQIDGDEVYHEDDLPKIIELLESENPDNIEFYANNFFGDYNHYVGDWGTSWGNSIPWRRIFRRCADGRFASHEPPRYRSGHFTTKQEKTIDRLRTQRLGIELYHYCYVKSGQIEFKTKFYDNTQYKIDWSNFKPGGRNVCQGVEVRKFQGRHPKVIQKIL